MGRENQIFGTGVVGVPIIFRGERAVVGSEKDEAATDAEGYGFGAGGRAELAEDGGYVELGGVVGDVEAGGDFLVGKAGG